LDDEDLRLKLGALGRKYIEEGLNWENDKMNLLLAYQKLFPKSFNPLVSDTRKN